MARKLGYLVVEGPHDVAFAIRLIQAARADLSCVQRIELLDETLRKLVPDKFPHGGDLLKRVPVPTFLQNDDLAIAIHSAGGDSKIAACLEDTFLIIESKEFSAVGIVLDSDSTILPQARHTNLLKLVESLTVKFSCVPGELFKGPPRTGIYVLPDNQAQGTLENLLLECGAVAYPEQLNAAKAFVDGVFSVCTGKAFSDLRAPAGRNKAVVGAVAGLLRPGKAVQVSIQDNGWLKGEALQIARVEKVCNFLDELFDLKRKAAATPSV
jgi:hypothetical protein